MLSWDHHCLLLIIEQKNFNIMRNGINHYFSDICQSQLLRQPLILFLTIWNQMVTQTVLIADKDSAFRRELRQKIESMDYPAVFLECNNGPEAVRHINAFQPGIVFINVSLPGMGAFDVLEKISHDPMSVVFSDCARDALRAFEYGVMGYLLKPISSESLKRTLIRIGSSESTSYDSLHQGARYHGRIFVEKGNSLKKIDVREITHLKAERDYTLINTVNNTSYLSNYGIGHLSRKLDPYR